MSYVYYSGVGTALDEAFDQFEVGHHKPNDGFIVESVWDTRSEAQAQVCYLNGGAHPQRNLEYGL